MFVNTQKKRETEKRAYAFLHRLHKRLAARVEWERINKEKLDAMEAHRVAREVFENTREAAGLYPECPTISIDPHRMARELAFGSGHEQPWPAIARRLGIRTSTLDEVAAIWIQITCDIDADEYPIPLLCKRLETHLRCESKQE